MTQQDDITQRLNEIHADAGYLFGRVAADGACAGAMAESVRARIDAIKALLSQVRAPVADERAVLADLLDYVDSNTCIHESTHRGGAIWTICDGCGAKWADDEGGFVPHQDAPAVAAARAALASAPVAGEAYQGDSVAERLDNMADDQHPGSQAQSDLYAAATHWRKHIAHRTAPQASAESVDLPGIDADRLRTIAGSGSQTAMTNALLNVARALKQPQADKDGGQHRARDAYEALSWYAEQVAGCRKFGPDGEAARHALDRDGGERARAALSATQPEQGERE